MDLTTRVRLLKSALNTYRRFPAIWLSCDRLNRLPIPSAKILTPAFLRSLDGLTTESCEIPSVITIRTWWIKYNLNIGDLCNQQQVRDWVRLRVLNLMPCFWLLRLTLIPFLEPPSPLTSNRTLGTCLVENSKFVLVSYLETRSLI